MSIYGDWDSEYAFERDYPFGMPATKNPVWTTKNGTKIPVSKMTDDHIKNCMSMVGMDDIWYEVFDAELKRRITNAEKFKQTFNGLTATELWSMPEKEFLEWLNKTE